MNNTLIIILLTLAPFLELRASIPYGIIVGLSWPLVFVLATTVNIILGFILYFFFDKIVRVATSIAPIKRLYEQKVLSTQQKLQPYIHKYGTWGLAIFIGIPLPGSGVYSGSIAAYALGMKKTDFYKAMIIGVLIAAILVTIIMLSGSTAFNWYLKTEVYSR
ncbi:small multi-drug export protein [Candidatus Woesearchaeota archaeon]|nr:small multi-drug export protein [Candidatus Woesearchaeota archaeon]